MPDQSNDLCNVDMTSATSAIALIDTMVPDVACFVTNGAGAITNWSSSAAELFGYVGAEIVGQPASKLSSDVLERDACQNRSDANSASRHLESDVTFVRKDGTQFHGRLTTTSIGGDGGSTGDCIHVVRDTTEIQRARETTSEVVAQQVRLFETTLSSIVDFAYVFDLDGRFTFVNRALLDLWGMRLQDAVGKTFFDLPYTDELAATLQHQIQTVIETKLPLVGETEYTNPAGSSAYYEYIFVPVFGEDALVEAVAGTTRDISLRRQAVVEKEELLRSLKVERERLAELFRQAPTFLAVLRGPNHVIEMVNRQYLALVGQRDIVGKPIVQALPEIEDQGFVRILDDVFQTGVPFVGTNVRVNLMREAGSAPQERFVDFVYQPFIEADGTITGVVAHGVDLTERKLAEDEQQRLQRVVEYSGDAIGVAELDLRTFYINRAGRDMLGIALRDVERHADFATLFSDDERQRLSDEILPRLRSVGQWEGEIEMRRPDTGARLPVSLNLFHIPDPKTGQPINVGWIARDVSDHKRLEEQLAEARKMEGIGRLAGGIAHDFNNLLTAILGYSELASGELEDDPECSGYLDQVRRAAERAANLTMQLLAFARRQVIQFTDVNLNDLLHESADLLNRMVGENVALSIETDPDLGWVSTNAGRFADALLNLATNARDAMPNGGRLLFQTMNVTVDSDFGRRCDDMPPGDYVTLVVSDTGVGIEDSVKQHIFEPFFSTKAVGRGTGLGLATVYGIVKQSEGFISVESSPGAGATFRLSLPRVEAPATAVTETTPDVRRQFGGVETILLVEDEEVVLGFAGTALRAAGYTVIEALHVPDAIGVGSDLSQHIDLVVSDVIMPDMNGALLAAELRSLRPGVRVLFMSGYTGDSAALNGVLGPDEDLIQKPFTVKSFTRRVREALDSNSS